MSNTETLPARELDVRPMLRAGEEPFQAIMDAVSALAPGQSLRLIAPFRPVPLFSVMANRGFAAATALSATAIGRSAPAELRRDPDETLAIGSSPSAVSGASR
ncbi:TusA-related sulfurtransferase OS=Bosea thiooxidans OX=53254 GN=ARD30_06025 PE=4 SV=1 [Bosea thiooxidans]